jgi:hypothetical protein
MKRTLLFLVTALFFGSANALTYQDINSAKKYLSTCTNIEYINYKSYPHTFKVAINVSAAQYGYRGLTILDSKTESVGSLVVPKGAILGTHSIFKTKENFFLNEKTQKYAVTTGVVKGNSGRELFDVDTYYSTIARGLVRDGWGRVYTKNLTPYVGANVKSANWLLTAGRNKADINFFTHNLGVSGYVYLYRLINKDSSFYYYKQYDFYCH